MAKLTDKQKKMIIAESIEGSSIRALAARYKVSTTTIQRVLKSDTQFKQKVAQKKQENAESVLAFMDSKKNDVCGLIEKFLAAMGDEDKIAATPLSQLATAMGIVIDKYTINESPQQDSTKANNLLEAIEGIGEEGLNDLPELQQAPEGNAPLVEDEDLPG